MSKSRVKELKRQGKVPGALHGKGKSALPLEVTLSDLAVVLRTDAGIHGIFDLSVEGAESGEGGTVVIKSIQSSPIGRKLLHVDFQRVSMSDVVTTSLPVETHGEAAGVRAGGVLELVMDELEVKSRADEIPTKIEVDVTDLQLGQFIHASDIPLPEGVELAGRPDDIVVSIRSPFIAGGPTAEAIGEEAPSAPEVEEA